MIKTNKTTITMEPTQSSCCGGGFKVVCSSDFIGQKEPDQGSTCHYKCLICGKPCDVEKFDGGKKVLLTISAQKRAT